MARGWESKSVEAQQSEDFDDRRERLSRPELERRQKRASLELSRVRVARELDGARTPAHRAALENALRFLEEELHKL